KQTPQSLYVNGYQTSNYSNEELLEIVNNNFDFSVYNIINELDLLNPIFRQTSNFGHFGHEDYPWEKVKTLNF
ncbi:MAG: methionine adenosyltransferase, partial [Erysipelothrix sp.]|nr:methionine adenosyltransferase [Erysipelothrix sp.]